MRLALLGCLSVFLLATSVEAAVAPASRWVIPMRLRHDFELQPQERTRPVVVGDVIYAANLEGNVYAIHRTDGYILWKYKMPAGVDGSLAYGRSKVIIGDTKGNLIALNARDGSFSWIFKIQTQWLAPVAFGRDKVIAMTSSDELYALSDTQGKELWHFSHRGDEKMTVHGTAAPAVFASEVYQGFSDGTEVALSLNKGDVLWTKRLRSRDRFYDVDMSAYVDESTVIAASFDGHVYAMNRLNGDTRWLLPVGSYGGFLVEEGRVYFAGLDNKLYAVDRENGHVIWSTPYHQGVGSTPARVGDSIVFATSSDPMYVVDMKTGELAGETSLGTGTLAAPVASPDGWFYTMSNYGTLYSFELQKTLAGAFPKDRVLAVPSLRPILVEPGSHSSDAR